MKQSKACRAYRKEHPFCELIGCGDWQIEVHHIRSRGAGGDDEPVNLMSLCVDHHKEFHTIGVEKFGRKYGVEERLQKALERKRK